MNERTREIILFSRKVASVVVFFIAVGPVVGGVIYVTIGATVSAVSNDGLGIGSLSDFVLIFFFALASLPFSYVCGLVPAAIAGLIIGVAQINCGRLARLIVLAVGAFVGVGYILVLKAAADFQLIEDVPRFTFFVLFLTCVASTFVCWGFVQNWYMQRVMPEKVSP